MAPLKIGSRRYRLVPARDPSWRHACWRTSILGQNRPVNYFVMKKVKFLEAWRNVEFALAALASSLTTWTFAIGWGDPRNCYNGCSRRVARYR